MVLDNSSRTIISSDGNLIHRGSSDIPFWTIEPEWRQTIGRDGFYLEPGVAGGWAFGFLQLDGDSTVSGDSYDQSDSSVYGPVFLRAGTAVRGGIAEFEASWMVSSDEMDFGGDATGKLGPVVRGVLRGAAVLNGARDRVPIFAPAGANHLATGRSTATTLCTSSGANDGRSREARRTRISPPSAGRRTSCALMLARTRDCDSLYVTNSTRSELAQMFELPRRSDDRIGEARCWR